MNDARLEQIQSLLGTLSSISLSDSDILNEDLLEKNLEIIDREI